MLFAPGLKDLCAASDQPGRSPLGDGCSWMSRSRRRRLGALTRPGIPAPWRPPATEYWSTTQRHRINETSDSGKNRAGYSVHGHAGKAQGEGAPELSVSGFVSVWRQQVVVQRHQAAAGTAGPGVPCRMMTLLFPVSRKQRNLV